VKLSQYIPWEEPSQWLSSKLLTHGRPEKDARLVIGAIIIKHKLCLSDEETIQQFRKNFYLQYFVGFPTYQGNDLPPQVEAYKQRYGHYPQSVLGDTITGTRGNKHYLK